MAAFKKLRKISLVCKFISLFLVSLLVIFLLGKEQLYNFFSPQGTIDEKTLTEEFSPEENFGVFDNEKVQIPPDVLTMIEEKEEKVLGEVSDKRIEIDLTNQRLYAYEGDRQIFNFLISSGKWGRTPTGTFHTWTKYRYTKMSGGSKALRTYYYLPNVPYVMYFYNGNTPKARGYGIHGTYWHNNFGHPMSHGCINMKTEEAELLYYWAPIGVPVVIYGITPRS